ncbi:deoxyribodipyrimidine photolyase [Vibrio ichthyoenteri ATCC 700023]|uniref:Deoxyribodipyrimidine photo-lyase n=1 Tax=Vibrio ichthyoenteri ATCC 700023 TaxID=870968 RepID=F9RX28_9VIBR|nr:deoxyribodipyrimidine photo-lyase [Vibrio ichthyoenteri]EGU48457.1 deoxyribodipyrimidine photolyase [Vibrio ichthyoenteri ATCC 700023]
MQLMWFRRDLRVEDNTALQSAIDTQQPVVALYVATPATWRQHHLSAIQADLIYRRLSELQSDLAQLNIPLLYVEVDNYQQSGQAVMDFAQTHGIERLVFNREYEVNEQIRDSDVESRAVFSVQGFDDKCLFAPGSVFNKQGSYFKVFTPFKRAYLSRLASQRVDIVKTAAATKMAEEIIANFSLATFSPNSVFSYPRQSSGQYVVRSHDIRQQLRDFCHDRVSHYHAERDKPSLNATSQLSPYLAIGALSVRQCIARVLFATNVHLDAGREMWISELVWRDFYQHLLHFEPKLCKGRNFVAWTEKVHWSGDKKHLVAWQKGETGYPIVDAAMRQLNKTGWMHNRLRMVVASFLTKDLHLHWRHGEEYFMQKLVDGDYAANNGGWQWSASTGCDGQPYFRIFNPTAQGERFDPDGDFVRHWVPELSAVPNKFIHQPWQWENVISLSYPKPMVDHKSEREITLRLFQDAKDFP